MLQNIAKMGKIKVSWENTFERERERVINFSVFAIDTKQKSTQRTTT